MKTALVALALVACAVCCYAAGPYVNPNARRLIGQPVKGYGRLKGQCATLCQLTCPGGMPLTRYWRRGIRVQGNGNRIAVGTVIATFLNLRANPSDPYNYVRGRHTAYYLGQNSQGIQVVHQYSRLTRIEQYTLRWSSCSTHMCGGAYYVVMSGVPNLSDAQANAGSSGSTPSAPTPRAPTPAAPSPAGGDKQSQVRATLKQVFTRLDEKAISGIMGNIAVETGTFDWQTRQIGGNGYGLFQYDFMKRYYFSWLSRVRKTDSALSQIQYAYHIIYTDMSMLGSGAARSLRTALEGSGSVSDKTIAFMRYFEKPGVPHQSRRVSAAESDYRRFVR